MRTVTRIALVLVIIGALNWGLIGLFQFDLVATLFGGQDSILSRIIYTLVGISGIVSLGILFETHDATDTDVEHTRFSNPNYGTEFGDEPDFTEQRDAARRRSDDDTTL
ncbi:DUF378 domain-containing protein [Sporosarcina gallistercoris]|uniref:DUF378 domain-containing protein n=1 Tax=Sporosarcina gallistercoris TaxID=2762245 RepID=A0ABR8PML5_9BACL|nr:DUF378 domain-containing protein [Sporosarcina gallistercoris]MBD7909382.1 DUF378 domain-containing protein [Sporosarcina gallistercoris]